jgi:hypothetical protein
MTFCLPADSSCFGVEDLYKLLHQAYLGPGHAIPSREAAESYLRREWEGLGAARANEPLVETLAEGAPFLRVNLRPFRDRGGASDSLLDAFVRSASTPTDPAAFARAWGLARERIAWGEIPLRLADYDSLEARTRPLGYPAIHHSDCYDKRMTPAYRVVARREADRLLRDLPASPHLPGRPEAGEGHKKR